MELTTSQTWTSDRLGFNARAIAAPGNFDGNQLSVAGADQATLVVTCGGDPVQFTFQLWALIYDPAGTLLAATNLLAPAASAMRASAAAGRSLYTLTMGPGRGTWTYVLRNPSAYSTTAVGGTVIGCVRVAFRLAVAAVVFAGTCTMYGWVRLKP